MARPRGRPDVLLIQETKLTDDDAPVMAFAMAGYDLVHHGEGRWNGVAIAAREGLGDRRRRHELRRRAGPRPGPGAPARGTRRISTRSTRRGCWRRPSTGIRLVSLYAPNGRVVGSPFYEGKLAWFERLRRWLDEDADAGEPLVIGGDFNIAPTDADVWDAKPRSMAAPTCPSRSARRSARSSTGASSTPTARATTSPADSRGGTTAPASSTRTSGCGSTTCS